MKTFILKIFILIFVITTSNNLHSQSYGTGAVTLPNYNINGVNFNISGDLNVRFVFIDNQPEVKLNWNWVKVNYISYKGVRYDSSNNPFKGNFDYIKSGFNGKVEVTMVAPTVNEIQKETRTVVSGIGSTSFVFTINKNIWEDYSFTERDEIKKKWKEQNHPLGVKLLSIDGINFINMASSVKSHWSKLQKEKESKNKTANTTNTSSKEKTENKTAEVKKELNERKEKKSEIKKTNTSNAYSRLSPSDKEKLRQISLQRRSTYQKLQDNFNYTNQITNNLINTINHYENQARKRQEERKRKEEQARIREENENKLMEEMRYRQNRLYSQEYKRIVGLSSELIDYVEDVGTLEDIINLAIEKNIKELYLSSVEIRIESIKSFENTSGYWQGDKPIKNKSYGTYGGKPILITYRTNPQKIILDSYTIKKKDEILKYFNSFNCDNCFGSSYSLRKIIVAGFDKYSVTSALHYYSEMLNSIYSRSEIKNEKQLDINSTSLNKIILTNSKKEKEKNIIKDFEERILTETFSIKITGGNIYSIFREYGDSVVLFISHGKYIKVIQKNKLNLNYNFFDAKSFLVEEIKSIKQAGYNFDKLASKGYYDKLGQLSIGRSNYNGFNNRFRYLQPTSNHNIIINKEYFATYSKYKLDKKKQDNYTGHFLTGFGRGDVLSHNMVVIEHGSISNKDGKILLKPVTKVIFGPALEVKGQFFKQKSVGKSLYERVFKTTFITSGIYPMHSVNTVRGVESNIQNFYKAGNTLISSYNIDKFNTLNSKPIRIYNLKGNLLTLKPSQNKSDFNTLFNLLNYKNISHLPYDFDM
ncbi:MAG: hypothetical protein GY739_03810 [Mesoflavibacter sp.]|nr:hypothetical protein [Mesoflavibacter sp.]